MTTAYPLTWPDTIPRAKTREKGLFKTSLAVALKNVQSSLALFSKDSGKAISGLVISSNVTLGQERPADPGVAVWFTWDSLPLCIPVDRYLSVEGNLQAIHHVIEARRTELRHGTLALVRASFQGFAALPPPPGKKSGWRAVLGVTGVATVDDVERAYREKLKKSHPDAGGSHDAMTALNLAREAARRELGN